MGNKKIINELIERIDGILKKYSIEPDNFLATAGKSHKDAHEEILQLLPEYIDEIGKDKEGFLGEVRENLILASKSEEYKKFKGHNLILRTYIRDFLNCLFVIRYGSVYRKGIEEFSLPNIVKRYDFDGIDENYKYLEVKMGNRAINPDRQVCLFILPNGTTYSCPIGHMVLANWLCANGISIKNAIRVEFNKHNYSVDLSTLGNCGFSLESNDDFNLELSDEQAQIFASIHNTLSEKWKFLKPLEENLKESYGLGLSRTFFNERLAKANLSKLEDYIESFNKNKYLRDLSGLYKVNRFDFSDEGTNE